MHHRLLWITDLHLEFQCVGSYAWLAKSIKSSGASALLLTGDIMPSLRLPSALVKLVESAGVPVYFVLGNHDYYGWSIAETETAVDQALFAVKKSKRTLIWLDRQDGPIPLDTRTALVGTGGGFFGF